MATYNIAWNFTERLATVHLISEDVPLGSEYLSSFDDENGVTEPDLTMVLYHKVRDALFKIGFYPMQEVEIYVTEQAKDLLTPIELVIGNWELVINNAQLILQE